MKKTLVLVFCLLFISASYSQTSTLKEAEKIQQANLLIGKQHYESAFKLLNEFDPKNQIVPIVLLKKDIAMNYYASHINHHTYFFKDLEPGENLATVRSTPGTFSIFNFPIDQVLDSLVNKYPEDHALRLALGTFYHDMHRRYGTDWIIKEEELLDKMSYHFNRLNQAGQGSFLTHYTVGCMHLNRNNFEEAVLEISRSLSFAKEDPSANYNLAYCYMNLDRHDSAIKYSKIALDLYPHGAYKADAARMTGQQYEQKNELLDAAKYYEQSISIDSLNKYSYLFLMHIMIKTNNFDAEEKLFQRYFKNIYESSEKHLGVEEVYDTYKRRARLIELYIKNIALTKDKDALGARYFYLGRLYVKEDNKPKAKAAYMKAWENYSANHKESDADMLEIESELKKLN